MINISTLKSEGFKGEFYKIHLQRQGFLFFPSPDLSKVNLFSKTKQRSLGKLNVHFNMTSIIRSQQFFKDVNTVLLTEYSEIIYLPFLSKLLP